jgi:hypothetical protein
MLYPLSKITGVEAVAGRRMNEGLSNANDPQGKGVKAELKNRFHSGQRRRIYYMDLDNCLMSIRI